jgi:anthranilate phosphoribosyltransferase
MPAEIATPLDFAAMLKEIGRGKHAARSLSREQAEALGSALATNTVPDSVLGAILIALRMKGESVAELLGLHHGLQDTVLTPRVRLTAPVPHVTPLVIPSYNGARRAPNLLPLLALMLREFDIPVLIHGPHTVAGRTATSTILALLGYPPARYLTEAERQLVERRLTYVPLEVLSPPLARLLAWRETLGVRNVGHTLVKLIEPLAGPSLRLIGTTHAAYRELLGEFLRISAGTAVLMRGYEGEAIASPQRLPAMEWIVNGETQTAEMLIAPLAFDPALEALPTLDAATTAEWIHHALEPGDGHVIPRAVCEQVIRLVWICGRTTSFEAARELVQLRFLPKDIT